MSYRTDTAVLIEVPLAEGKYSAQVQKLRKKDGAAARAALLGSDVLQQTLITDMQTRTTRGEAQQALNNNAYTDELLLRGIVRWNLTGDPGDDMDENGILRITKKNFEVLQDEDVQALAQAINKLLEGPDDALKNGSASGSSSSSS